MAIFISGKLISICGDEKYWNLLKSPPTPSIHTELSETAHGLRNFLKLHSYFGALMCFHKIMLQFSYQSQLYTRSLRQMLCGSHIEIWNLANHMKKEWNKEHHTLSFQFFINKSSILMFFVLFFMWFARFKILISEP